MFRVRETAALDGNETVVFDFFDNVANRLPVDRSFPNRNEVAAVGLALVKEEIFDVQFAGDSLEGAKPIFRLRILHMVAQIEIGFDPDVIERSDKSAEKLRGAPEIIPHVFETDRNPFVSGDRDRFFYIFNGRDRRFILRLNIIGIRRVIAFADAFDFTSFGIIIDLKIPRSGRANAGAARHQEDGGSAVSGGGA